jgi:magnesium transporter
MPELHWKYGYLAIVGLMLTACLVMYRAFKKSGWL